MADEGSSGEDAQAQHHPEDPQPEVEPGLLSDDDLQDDVTPVPTPTPAEASPSSASAEPDPAAGEAATGEEPESYDGRPMAGWLLKLGAKGLIKFWRRRWFVFDPKQCALFYYRSAPTATAPTHPAAYIDMSAATLSFVPRGQQAGTGATPPLAEGGNTHYGQFYIHVHDRTFQLIAENSQAMMEWMSGLQKHRQAYLARNPKAHIQDRYISAPAIEALESLVVIGSTDTSTAFSRGLNSLANKMMNPLGSLTSSSKHPSDDEADDTEQPPKPLPSKSSLTNFGLGLIKRRRQDSTSCAECARKQKALTAAKEELRTLRAEHQHNARLAHDLTVKMQAKESASVYAEADAAQRQTLFEHQQEQIVRLQERLEALSAERSKAQGELAQAQATIRDLQESEGLLKERHLQMIEVVEKLTTELDQASRQPSAESPVMEVVSESRSDSLAHRCQVFESQNAFLNAEIIALSELRKRDEQRHRFEVDEMRMLEERLKAVRAEHAELLRMSCEGVHLHEEDLIRMAEETLQSERLRETPEFGGTRLSGPMQYDDYGFPLVRDLACALHRLRKTDGGPSPAQLSRWEQYFAMRGDKPFEKDQIVDGVDQLKHLIRSGIPDQFRGTLWADMVDFHVRGSKKFNGPGYYDELTHATNEDTVAVQQIELDLMRTFPSHRHFSDEASLLSRQLRRVLIAFSRHNSKIGYCQGLNMMAAFALLFLDEEAAFWTLVAIVEILQPPDYYSSEMIGARADQRVLIDLMKERLPKLHAHLEKHGIDLSLITFNWFLTVFVECVPTQTALRIWDVYLYEGAKAPFRFALGILKLNEASILRLNDKTQIFSYVKTMAKQTYDVHALCKTAFQDLEGWQGFSMKNINDKRFHRTEEVKEEALRVQKLREQRAAMRASTASLAAAGTSSDT